MGVKVIQKKVKIKYLYNISYGKAWRAKQRTLGTIFGSFQDAYDVVIRILHMLQVRNLGTYVNIQDFLLTESSQLTGFNIECSSLLMYALNLSGTVNLCYG
jgi:hypothetical protein